MAPSKKQAPALEQNVLEFIRRQRLIQAGQNVLVAVSGGPDSVCLLHILQALQNELQITLHVAHMDHGLRGAEAEADAQCVAGLATRLNLPATIEKRDVAAYQTAHRLSPEEAAREVRYAFLTEVAAKIGADVVAVGHTQNDQIETVLLHIIRGTGTRGLRGLRPLQALRFPDLSLTIIRPLLEVDRASTEEYCKVHKLAPRQDSSNLALVPLRNRVRLELLPLLKTYNPEVSESLLRIARLAGAELDFLDIEAHKAWQTAVSRQGQTLMFDKRLFISLAPAIQRELLRRAFSDLLGTLKDIEDRHIEELLDSLSKPAGRTVSLPGGLIFTVDYNVYRMGFDPEEQVPLPEIKADYDISVPGLTIIPGWQIEATIKTADEFMAAVESRDLRENDGFTDSFDYAATGDRIMVRARRRGDWFQPLGMDQPKKVGRFMLDARIPRTWRPRIPVFCIPQQIIWLAGWRLDERVKVTHSTQTILCLKMVKST
ncbi:MAG TPA: tRNA lysidine(34) synthetase TilS [Dehalococcoidales bacterium]